jgi:hypothetical protein
VYLVSGDTRRTLTCSQDARDLINSFNGSTVLPVTEPDRSPRTTSAMLQRRICGNTAPVFRVCGRAEGETRRTPRCVSDHLLQPGSLPALNYPLTPGRGRRKIQSAKREGYSIVLQSRVDVCVVCIQGGRIPRQILTLPIVAANFSFCLRNVRTCCSNCG